MRQNYFGTVFGFAGDNTAIPVPLQSGGQVSFNQGWTYDYQRDQTTDPAAKPIDRATMNWLFGVITAQLQQYQQAAVPEWISATDNGGTPFPYEAGVRVRYSSNPGTVPFSVYVNLVANNTNTPNLADPTGATSNWQLAVYQISTSAQAAAGTDNSTIMTPSLVAQQTALRALLAGSSSQVFNVGPATAASHAVRLDQMPQYNAALLNSNTTLSLAQSQTIFEVSGAPTITLPGPAARTTYYLTATSGGFTLTSGGATIFYNGNSGTSFVFPAGASIEVYSDGGSWLVSSFSGASATPAPLDNSTRNATTAFANGIGAVVGSMRNAKVIQSAAATSLTFTADEVVVATALGAAPQRVANVNKSINLGTVGAGGMDTGAAPNNGYVAIYLIYNPSTGVSNLLATNATGSIAPNVYSGTLPSGYAASALVSVWPTNGSGQFIVGVQRDRRISRGSVQSLNTSTGQASYTALTIATAVPPNAVRAFGAQQITNNTVGAIMTMNIASDTGGSGVQAIASYIVAAGVGQGVNFACDVAVAQTLYYQTTNSAGTPTFQLYVSGYEF